MNYLKYIGLLLFIFLCGTMQAQDTNTIDMVYLKDGSIFRGTIVEYEPGGILRLRINRTSTITLQDARIKKIVQKGTASGKGGRKEYAFKERGFYNATYGNLSISTEFRGNDPVVDVGIHNITGYQFNRFLGVGLGVGMDYYYIGSGENIMPVYVEGRGYLKAKNVSPMYSLAAGYGFAFTNDERNLEIAKGGMMIYPAFGFRLGGSDNANFLLDFGVKIQKAEFTFDRGWEIEHNRMTFNRFIIRTGLMF